MQGDPPFTFAPIRGILNYSDLNPRVLPCRPCPLRSTTTPDAPTRSAKS